MSERIVFGAGIVAGAVLALVVTDRLLALRRARAAELRARAEVLERDLQWLERVDQLAAGNAAAAA